MRFGEYPVHEAAGVMLAHTLTVGTRTFKKGRTLSAGDVEIMRRAGQTTVLGARLDDDDAAENPAAAEIAKMLADGQSGVVAGDPYTGRCNLHAGAHGLFEVDPARIDAINRIDESITVATLPQHTVVRTGQVVASVKIIPFAIPGELIESCRRHLAGHARTLAVQRFNPCRAALIISGADGPGHTRFDAMVEVTGARLARLGGRIALPLHCAHETAALVARLEQALAAGCDLVLIAGATVAKDRCDTVPAAVTAAGGRIERFGMPTEPGNMLVMAHIGAVPVIVLPGCARSRRTNGLDRVLRHVLAGRPPTSDEIACMGVGGLIRNPLEPGDDTEAQGSGAVAEAVKVRPRVTALVLAAGRSTRMEGPNKLLLPVAGVPMVLRAASAALASRASSVTVVVGHEADAVEATLAGLPLRIVRNPDYAQGMSTSLRRGLESIPSDAEAVVVLLGDMPFVSAAHVDRVLDAFVPSSPAIVVPMHNGRRGHPVLWPRDLFAEMSCIVGDRGARELFERHAQRIVGVEVDDDGVHLDIDRPADLALANEAGT